MVNQSRRWTRRGTVAAGIGALAAAGLLPVARTAAQKGTGSGGIGGGGQVRLASGDATFTLFAEKVQLAGAPAPIFFGRILWLDPNWQGGKLLLESTLINQYGPIPGNDKGREIHGLMTMNGKGSYPFVMQAIDNGAPASGQDTITLTVGAAATGTPTASPVAASPVASPAASFTYTASGPVVAGDIAIIFITLPE